MRYTRCVADGLCDPRQRVDIKLPWNGERFARVPPIRAFVAELREAEARDARGEPAHLPEMILRLTRASMLDGGAACCPMCIIIFFTSLSSSNGSRPVTSS